MQQYLVNFVVWWYGVKVRQMFKSTLQWFVFILEYSNTLPMARNFTVPLFQDMTRIGRVVGVVIRAVWIWFGGIFSIVLGAPVWLFLVVYALLPVILVAEVALGIVHVFL